MSRIKCTIVFTSAENDEGREVDAVAVTCSKCGHETISWGQDEPSVKRCLALLNEECPKGENNFYVVDD